MPKRPYVAPETDLLRELIHEILQRMVDAPGELRYFFAPKFCAMYAALSENLKEYILTTLRFIFKVVFLIGIAGDCMFILNYYLSLSTRFISPGGTGNVIYRLRTSWNLEKDMYDRFAVAKPLPHEREKFDRVYKSAAYQSELVRHPGDLLNQYKHLFVPEKKKKQNARKIDPIVMEVLCEMIGEVEFNICASQVSCPELIAECDYFSDCEF